MNTSKTTSGGVAPGAGTVAGWWILYCTFWTAIGWILSLAGLLNPVGYGIAVGLGMVLVILFRTDLSLSPASFPPFRKVRSRFRRFFPRCFLFLAVLATLGGILYAPGNPDGLTQRIPRTLAWLAEGRWLWMENVQASFNSHATGFEWLMAPMFAFLKTDRVVFLYNTLSYLLMPGLVFSVFHRLGVRKRVAWYWMWLAPAGLCFAMQAGSVGNDMVGSVLALASVHFALRARETRSAGDLWLSALAVALTTGMKASNLPLGLPWLVAAWPGFRYLKGRLVPSAAVGMLAMLVSLVPVMVMNRAHNAGWFGSYSGEEERYPGPAVALPANVVNLSLGNFLPPVFPMAGWWNDNVYKTIPEPFLRRLEKGFEPGAAHFSANEFQFEVSAGLGMGVSLLVVISWLAAKRRPSQGQEDPRTDWHLLLARWAPWISGLFFIARMNVSGPGRLFAPYYCLLLPLLLAGVAQSSLVCRGWWKAFGIAVFLLAAGMVVINPPRALWPAKSILEPLARTHPESEILKRSARLYRSYAERWDALASIRNQLPPDARDVGFIMFISGSTMEASLWRPFGSRRIVRLPKEVTAAELRRQGIKYVVIGTDSSASKIFPGFETWLQTWPASVDGQIIAREGITILATADPVPWYIVRISNR